MSTQMNALFWKRFAAQVWEKKSMAFPNIDSPLRDIDAERVFQMLVSYADLCRKANDVGGFKLFLEGVRQYDDETLQVLPQKKDKSLTGYHQRMQKLFSDYCLVCDELLQVSEQNWGHLSRFTHELYRHVGFPHRFSEIGLYLGNYQKTPFGVHVDNCGVFSFPVVGTKKFRIWDGSYVKKNPDLVEAHQYDKFKKNSQVLTAKPGDMTYWPSQAWHIAESDGSFSATWSLGVWVDRPHKDVIGETLKSFLEQTMGPDADRAVVPFKDLHGPSGEVSALPSLYQKTQKVLQALDEDTLHDLLTQNWLTQISKQGLKTSPRAKMRAPLSAQDAISLRLPSPILWSPLQKTKKTCVAFAGETYFHEASVSFLKLLKHLNEGQTCLVAKYLKGPGKSADLRLLQTLQSRGALEIRSRPAKSLP